MNKSLQNCIAKHQGALRAEIEWQYGALHVTLFYRMSELNVGKRLNWEHIESSNFDLIDETATMLAHAVQRELSKRR